MRLHPIFSHHPIQLFSSQLAANIPIYPLLQSQLIRGTHNIKFMNQTETIEIPNSQPLEPEQSQILGIPLTWIPLLVIGLFLIAYFSMSKKKGGHKNKIVLIGQRSSGKTQLFISLNGGKKMKTSPSIENNKTTYEIEGKKYEMIDFIGDNISKEEILGTIHQIHCIVHVIDGSDAKSLSDAAMFIYKVLASKNYQKHQCQYLIFLNKSDITGFVGKAAAQKKLQDQIEHIKQSRINQAQENQNEDDYIKLSKTRFKLGFKIIEGSAQTDVKDLQMTLQNL